MSLMVICFMMVIGADLADNILSPTRYRHHDYALALPVATRDFAARLPSAVAPRSDVRARPRGGPSSCIDGDPRERGYSLQTSISYIYPSSFFVRSSRLL